MTLWKAIPKTIFQYFGPVINPDQHTFFDLFIFVGFCGSHVHLVFGEEAHLKREYQYFNVHGILQTMSFYPEQRI